jgi:hypothetical protein
MVPERMNAEGGRVNHHMGDKSIRILRGEAEKNKRLTPQTHRGGGVHPLGFYGVGRKKNKRLTP